MNISNISNKEYDFMRNFYNEFEFQYNIIYSLDMLRLTTYITYEEYTKLEFHLKSVFKDLIELEYTSFKLKDFRYNYVISVGEDKTFWFGFLHNSERIDFNKSLKYNLTIEFNPNKVKKHSVLLLILHMFGDWKIKSYDIACDLPIHIRDFCGFEKGRKKNVRTISNSIDDFTVYIGKSNNRVKIYNKKLESNIDVFNNLTRVEVSVNADSYPVSEIFRYSTTIVFPELFTNKYLYSFSDYNDRTLLAVLYAVQSGFDISLLSRRYKEKVKNLLEGGHRISFVKKCVDNLLKVSLTHYFSGKCVQRIYG